MTKIVQKSKGAVHTVLVTHFLVTSLDYEIHAYEKDIYLEQTRFYSSSYRSG